MKVRKFIGANSREALRDVKRELGADAVILSNRAVEGGVEIAALANDELAAVTAGAKDGQAPAPDAARNRKPSGEPWFEAMVAEIKTMRGMLEDQLGGLAWGDLQRRTPARAQLLRELLHSGFSPALTRLLIEKLPAGADLERGQDWLRSALAHNLRCAAEDEIVGRGGVYALMGPTGVGKTTTTAKLAARCVVRHGAERLALLTTDSYRVGAHEQLRIYGKILGVSVHAVRDAEDLQVTLAELRNKHMVLIDTVGMSQRDRLVAEQVAMLSGCGGKVNRLLLLNASGSADNLDDVVRAYRGGSLHGVILTKMDEAVSLGAPLDVVIRHKLMLHYVADGQRVPEDLHHVNRDRLTQCALQSRSGEIAYHLGDSEIPVLLAADRSRASGALAGA